MDLSIWKEEVIAINIWYIALAILVFSSLIFIHEFGHYLCARLCGVGVYEFAIGMGPRLFGWTSKKSGIKYSVRAFPIGGYVSMVGEDEESESEEAFCNRPIWKRMLIVVAGPAMNLLLGFLAMLILVASAGRLGGTEIVYRDTDTEYVSEASGLKDGDVILKVGNVFVFEANSLVYEISHQGDAPIDITVRRGGEKIVVENVLFPQREQSGVVFGDCDFKVMEVPFSFGNVVKHTFFRSASTVKMVVDSFTDLLTRKYGVETISGPVGITQVMGEAAKSGFNVFLNIFVIITINLGVFNLFPVPALDGGRFLFLLIEAVIRKPLNRTVEGIIHFVGLAVLLLFVVFVTLNDIIRLF